MKEIFLERWGGLFLGMGICLLSACSSDATDPDESPVLPVSPNLNANLPMEGYGFVDNYAIPHIDGTNRYVEHTVTYDNRTLLNYAMEWNDEKRHAVWVAFTFDDITSQNNVKRTDAWDVDPLLPPEVRTTEEMHKSDGFDKGHLVASYDRVYSVEANKQTFYYSNISPQFNSFNSGFWASFEAMVQRWARSGTFSTLYVVKGGTLEQLWVNFTGTRKGADGVLPQTDSEGLTRHGLPCPRYYFMAVLGERLSAGKTTYQSVGFWMEHRDDYGYDYENFAPSEVIRQYTLSIDDLEQKTGLDFFCNLPDDIETEVERSFDVDAWSW